MDVAADAAGGLDEPEAQGEKIVALCKLGWNFQPVARNPLHLSHRLRSRGRVALDDVRLHHPARIIHQVDEVILVRLGDNSNSHRILRGALRH